MGKRPLELSHSKFRSALTTGRSLLADIDGRSSTARRFRDLLALYTADLGGPDAGLSEGQLALVRRAATLTTELERMEAKFAQNEGAKIVELEAYQRATNTLRRLLESLTIHRGRIARNVTEPIDQYIKRVRDHDVEVDVE